MHRAATVSLGDAVRVEAVQPVLCRYHRRDVLVQPLQRVTRIGALLNAPVVQREIVVYHIEVREELFRGAQLLVLFAVKQVGLDQRKVAVIKKGLFDGVLHLFDGRRTQPFLFGEFAHYFVRKSMSRLAVGGLDGPHGFENGLFDFFGLKRHKGSVTFDDLLRCVAAVHLCQMF